MLPDNDSVYWKVNGCLCVCAEFSSALCPETWQVNNGIVVITGQSEAVKNAQALELKRQTEMTDAFGNTVQVQPTSLNPRPATHRCPNVHIDRDNYLMK